MTVLTLKAMSDATADAGRQDQGPRTKAFSVKVGNVWGLRQPQGAGMMTVQLHLIEQGCKTAEVMAETKHMGSFTNIVFNHEFVVELLQHQRLKLHVAHAGAHAVLLGSLSLPQAADGYPEVTEDTGIYVELQTEYMLQEHIS